MKKLIDFSRDNLSEKEIEEGMSNLMKDKFNKELKARYAKKLEQEHLVHRVESDQNELGIQTHKETVEPSKIKWLLPLLLIGVLIAGTYLIRQTQTGSSQPSSTQQMVQQYLAANEVAYVDNNRSTNKVDAIRTTAVKDFQDKNYNKAATGFAKIKDKTNQDQFFLAYSLLKMDRYKDAGIGFANLLSNTQSDQAYHPEAEVYRILSLIQLKGYDRAKLLYKQLKEGSWEKNELKGIMNSLD